MLAMDWGWKSVSLTVAVCSLLVVPLVFFFLGESPQKRGLKPYGAPEDWAPPPKNTMPAGKLALDTLRQAAKEKTFWYLVLSFFVCGLSTNGLVGTHFIPAAHDHGMMEPVAAGLLALVGVFDVVGTLASGWLTDRFDARRLLFAYYGLRGLSLFLLPSILFSTVHPSTLVFVIFYGLDWVATVPPTILLCRKVLGPERGTVVYGWVFASHQIGGAVAAFGAALLRVQFGDYALAFYISAVLCLVAAYLVLRIARPVSKVAAE
jgi:predicted MFS family arabinose efflux permease